MAKDKEAVKDAELKVGFLIDLLSNVSRDSIIVFPGDLELQLLSPDGKKLVATLDAEHPHIRFQYADETAQHPGVPLG